ncbi:uncharacterized protein LOC114332365 [Diabrotica virgifera virgifera]|uniref:Uncharacterized protein LOC114332365 n=1 Tax=Diabrotica virgifera virgifera TaxID=50390 RepID=A0A6P7FP44_DIAVI|nr:uncharacterized protein LOC114332365 [Diabrotica virgifera virgifera]
MFAKLTFFAICLAVAFASPVPEPKADPSLVAAAYTAPVVAAPFAAYSYPVAYSSYVAPSVYSAGYTAYSPYTASYVVV